MTAPDCGAGCGASGLHSVTDCLRRRGLPAALAPCAGEVPALRVALLDAYCARNAALAEVERLREDLRLMRAAERAEWAAIDNLVGGEP